MRRLGEEIDRLDALVNNAGVALAEREVTVNALHPATLTRRRAGGSGTRASA